MDHLGTLCRHQIKSGPREGREVSAKNLLQAVIDPKPPDRTGVFLNHSRFNQFWRTEERYAIVELGMSGI